MDMMQLDTWGDSLVTQRDSFKRVLMVPRILCGTADLSIREWTVSRTLCSLVEIYPPYEGMR
jgi:hypothetical protein